MTILTVFIPIWILSVICLLAFFQENSLKDRLATVAVLALAFVSFIPTINATLPPSPSIKLVDILIMMNISSIILLMVDSFDNYQNNYEFIWRENKLFKAAIILSCLTFAVVLLLYILHKCYWEPQYQSKSKYDKDKKRYKKIKRNLW